MVRTFDLATDVQRQGFIDHVKDQKESLFTLWYFNLHGVAYITRLIFAAKNIPVKQVIPTVWQEDKPKTFFNVLPILQETIPSSSSTTPTTTTTTTTSDSIPLVLEIPETFAIEQYLARKFHLLGSDAFEHVQVDAFVNSIQSVTQFHFTRVNFIVQNGGTPEFKQKMMDRFLLEEVPAFIEVHEQHLQGKESGFYVGDQLSLADLKLVQLIKTVNWLLGTEEGKASGELFSNEKTPGLWRVWETVNALEGVKAFKGSEEYQELNAGNMRYFGFL